MRLVLALAQIAAVVGGSWLAADTLDALAFSGVPVPGATSAGAGVRDANASGAPSDRSEALRVIAARNVFFHGEPPPDEDAGGEAISIPAGACTLPLEAAGAVLVRANPELSLAALRDRVSGRIDVFQIGDDVAPGATLAAVLPDGDGGLEGVEVAFADGHRERCGATPGASASVSAPPPPGVPGAGAPSGRTVVSSAEVSRLYADGFTSIASQMRALPADGGWKLFGVPGDSVLASAGIRSGDVVKRVNGHEVRTAQDALALVGLLRNERDITVDLDREGRPTTLEVAIR